MKEEAQQAWEAEVRRVVETHEFEYDPAAWAGMEELLDTTPPATGSNAGSWWAGAWKWLLPSIVAVVAVIWLVSPIVVVPPSIQGTFPIRLETEKESAPGESTASSTITTIPPQAKALPRLPSRPLNPLTIAEPKLPDPVIVVPPPVLALPSRRPAMLLQPGKSDDPLNAEAKRKRNRKTLFPDVIKNY